MIKIFKDKTPDDLSYYVQWFMETPFTNHNRVIDGIRSYGKGTTSILDRRSVIFQAEFCTFPGHCHIPEHIHPNVDTIEVMICGSFNLILNGEDMQGRFPKKWADEHFINRGVRIDHDVPHSVTVGAEGASFISFQRWNKGKPTTIGDDWVGDEFCSKEHEERVNEKAS